MKKVWHTIRDAYKGFAGDGVLTMAAAMTYFAALSLAPLLILLVTAGGLLGPDLQQAVIDRVQSSMGSQAGGAMTKLLENAQARRVEMTFSAVAGLAVVLFGATIVMTNLQKFLNNIFGVKHKKGFLFNWLYKRVMSLLMLFGIGLLLIGSVIVSSLISNLIPQKGLIPQIVNTAVTLLLFTMIFMFMFWVLPDVVISWKSTFIGGFITAVLFTAGQFGISQYLATKGTSSVYGAAGFLIILLLWLFYTGVIVLLGAELTHAYIVDFGKKIKPNKFAQWDPEKHPEHPETAAGQTA